MKSKPASDPFNLVFALIKLAFAILALIAVLSLPIVSAVMESRTYNKLTGAETTWFDALWVDLRVVESTR